MTWLDASTRALVSASISSEARRSPARLPGAGWPLSVRKARPSVGTRRGCRWPTPPGPWPAPAATYRPGPTPLAQVLDPQAGRGREHGQHDDAGPRHHHGQAPPHPELSCRRRGQHLQGGHGTGGDQGGRPPCPREGPAPGRPAAACLRRQPNAKAPARARARPGPGPPGRPPRSPRYHQGPGGGHGRRTPPGTRWHWRRTGGASVVRASARWPNLPGQSTARLCGESRCVGPGAEPADGRSHGRRPGWAKLQVVTAGSVAPGRRPGRHRQPGPGCFGPGDLG